MTAMASLGTAGPLDLPRSDAPLGRTPGPLAWGCAPEGRRTGTPASAWPESACPPRAPARSADAVVLGDGRQFHAHTRPQQRTLVKCPTILCRILHQAR